MKSTNTNYLVALFISTVVIFFIPQFTFGQHCFYVLNLQDSGNCRTELMSETGEMHTNPVQWKVMGDNTGPALACLEPIPDFTGCNDYTTFILEFFFNRTGFLLDDDFVKIQIYDNQSLIWNDALYLHASDINSEPNNKSYHVCAITPDMYRSIADFRLRILVNSSSNGSPMFIRNAEIWMSEITLPLELGSFTASPVDSRNVLLKWTTQNEQNVNRFEIERSENASNWQTVGKVNYTNTTQGQYTFQDQTNGANMYYYRLKIIDNDNQYAYSPVVSLHIKVEPPRIFPTIANDILYVEIDFMDNTDLYIYNSLGSIAHIESGVSGIAQINVSKLPPGTYFIQSIFKGNRFGQMFMISR